MTFPEDMDPECLAICEAMNLVPGIRTTESCCGHGKHPYRIYFVADSLDSLPPLLYWFSSCHCGHYGWSVRVTTDCAMSPVHFHAEGPVGDEGYSQAHDIAHLIKSDQKTAKAEATEQRTG